MKIFKTIKLYRRLRTRQEQLLTDVINWSQISNDVAPMLNEFRSVNKAVDNVLSKIPSIYFLFYTL